MNDSQECQAPRVFEFGCAPDAARLGYSRIFELIHETEAKAVADWSGQDVILVKGAAMGYDPRVMEFAVLKKEPPAVFQIGDVVTYTNDYGVQWPGLTVVGNEFWQRFEERRYFYAPSDAPWYSVPESSLKLECRAPEPSPCQA
ncbi:hypothetical protein AQB9606_04563 [Aquabacterium sp. CECT 9606]|nr:hypothetical protein AQB9606_04563 [Aquabacterium sp. CECT 9606]